MQLTVKEIINMIDSKRLHYDQTTQRNFVYNDISVDSPVGKISKAGKVIRAILKDNIQLPAVYFWLNDDGTYNIHDGKQRILSLYYALKDDDSIHIITNIEGKDIDCNALSNSEKETLLNYTFDVVVKKGSKKEEEKSFYEINTNSLNLTDYECIRGMFYGNWLTGFEEYIQNSVNVYSGIRGIGRGEQAIQFLALCADSLKENQDAMRLRIQDYLSESINGVQRRDLAFNPDDYRFNEVFSVFSRLNTAFSKAKSKTLLQVAKHIVDGANNANLNWDVQKVINYYEEIKKSANDVQSWDFDIHKRAIEALMKKDIKLDGMRFFDKSVKNALYRQSQKCAHEGCTETIFDKLEVDHILAWSKGGRTDMSNAQLLCKSHNSQKCDSENESE